ncbi:DUF6658 family protein [Aerosakkonema funiforme]|uniref:Uncharacterized protein n=1 Tax=Aerosakkonema funiforme FACHB-1375 TaxID=2949571 RepID=A0A926VKH8_9CYAN|nr:DUF6658 family protein [Aerosakkonema funiforme]MBD2184923.1 hypothetical protein [Aerosakkonema funiforme FACHB-1375]
MNKVVSFIKQFNFLRVLTVFFAGVILFVSTACGSPSVQAKALDRNPRPEIPEGAVTNTYKGGMNDFSDVDPRFDESKANKKADRLVNNAEHNIEYRADSPEQYGRNYRSGTPLGERVQNIGENIGESATNTAKDVAKGTRRGIENIKDNSQDAAKDVSRSADIAKDRAGQAADNTKHGLDKVFNQDKY